MVPDRSHAISGVRDKMPRKVWHNVLMGQSAAILCVSPPPFTFDWREIERGLRSLRWKSFPPTPALPSRILLEVVIPARTLKHRRQRQEPLSLDESDRLARWRDSMSCRQGLRDPEKARRWADETQGFRFEERTPLTMSIRNLVAGSGRDADSDYEEGFRPEMSVIKILGDLR